MADIDVTRTQSADTIVAVATAPGQAGVGIVRVSGSAALAIGERIAGPGLKARQAHYRAFRDASGEVMDSGVLLFFAAPASFTGEDVVEFQGHGGPVVLAMLSEEILRSGARLARPGEFTERAFLNGKLDLAQAEAVADLISGASEAAVRGATRSLSGAFSARVHEIDEQVVDLRVFIEAAIDFPDEELDLLADGQIAEKLQVIHQALTLLRADCVQGVKLRDGIKLALIGPPNVGKSSLLNRLIGESRAIVTDIPGTTRDLIRADLDLDGLPVEIVDTAGLREAGDAVEAEGVRRAVSEAEQADIVLLISAIHPPDRSIDTAQKAWDRALTLDPKQTLRVLNKLDLAGDRAEIRRQAAVEGLIAVSAVTGDGLDELRRRIRERAGYVPSSGLFTARQRHLVALEQARAATGRALELASATLPGELIAEELRAAHTALGEIVGEMTSDALLGEIFSRFCIGK
ncbi:MAG TPA: tRNA uridine-5-carboxymethylaminomethyl(34) synthesis GTPase MnmE [Pseudomonadales bacterium]